MANALISRIPMLLLTVLVAGQVAKACSCSEIVDTGPCRGLSSGTLFVGTVLSVEHAPSEEDKNQSGVARYRFRVDEVVSGQLAPEVEVSSGRGGGDCSYWFRVGQQYLVQPAVRPNQGLWASLCSMTQPTESASALLPQLRAMRDSRDVASLYGVLRRFSMVPHSDFVGGVSSVGLALKGENSTYTTKTDEQGAYAFYGIPSGNYQLTADLQSSLTLDTSGEPMNVVPVELGVKSCIEKDVLVTSTARVRGSVVFPDGSPAATDVQLFPVEKYTEKARGMWEYQGGNTPYYFEFTGVPPGDYLLVANQDRGRPTADNPFERTFYPGTTQRDLATPIHVREGEQVRDLTLHVVRSAQTRQVTIKIETTGTGTETYFLSVTGPQDLPLAKEISAGVYRVEVQRGVVYTVTARAVCSNTQLTTDPVMLDGSGDVSEIRLTFAPKSCSRP